MTVIESLELPKTDGKYTYRLNLLDDYDASVEGEECYDEDALNRYKDGLWSFVCVQVVASKAGIELGTAYLGGVEYGSFSREAYFDIKSIAKNPDYMEGMIDDATADADETLKSLMETTE